ncbi:ATP-binding protein [Agrobacterium tumefaciens]|uniref:YobI family P-loop NTPase n=1 Tax=Agrobacterium tumefaciens TaxID=358 RepID=UPI00129A4544|nr:ATP-binding protein [Agrobacterium tumefaciens]MRH96560.1 ATP-binding protein [Agrobacterium tumefaciens]
MSSFKNLWREFFKAKPRVKLDNRFVDLAPTDDADRTGVYSSALNAAIGRENVFNIALTGPYGSGKSSVIKTFLKSYEGKALPLSLASFIPEAETEGKTKLSKQEIERSILQQLLYGANANNLPHSRFKRIQTPHRLSILSALALCVGLFCAWYLFNNVSIITNGKYFTPWKISNWFNYVAFVSGIACIWWLAYGIYVKSFDVSLKSVSLKDIQIAPKALDQESILNRHLDEIIYFFQSTEYDLVIIEDLDRFEEPHIFVTLREINALVNQNSGIRRRIRFIYALRDEIFVTTDRTKFFEFIIPIIPVINHSNSIDKVLTHVNRIGLAGQLDPRFLRDVSRYLDDMRLIANVFNEYIVYYSNLTAQQNEGVIDANRLLAILIYKNVMPKDFASLHKQDGLLIKALRLYEDIIAKAESQIRLQINEIQGEIDRVENHTLDDIRDLRRVFAIGIISQLPPHTATIATDTGQIGIGKLPDHPDFEKILSGNTISITNQYGQPNSVQLSSVEKAINSSMTYAERKNAIESQAADSRARISEKLEQLKREIPLLRMKKFHEILRTGSALIDETFGEASGNRDLLRYLILEGYLDDSYHQYISLFHGERLSPHDHQFLLQIRAYKNPRPNFQLNNIPEVLASMREDDFGREYVLNLNIFEYMLENCGENATRIDRAIAFVKENFDECEEFFTGHYATGKFTDRLISMLLANWSDFPLVALEGSQAVAHAARILAFAPEEFFASESKGRAALSKFLSENLSLVLDQNVDFEFKRLKVCNVVVTSLISISDYSGASEFIIAEKLYRISIENIRHIMAYSIGYSNLNDLETRNYTAVCRANDSGLRAHIDANFGAYLTDVLLSLKENTFEDARAVVEVLNHEEVDFDSRAQFLEMQSARIHSLSDVPEGFYEVLLLTEKVESTWENCLKYINSDIYDDEVLTSYLQRGNAAEVLSETPVADGEQWRKLRQFLVNNEAFDDEIYRSYISNLPNQFTKLPSVGSEKLRILIKARKISFSSENFEAMDEGIKPFFIATNFNSYWSDRDEFEMDDSLRGELLQERISEAQKMLVISEIDPNFIVGHPEVAALVAPVLNGQPIPRKPYHPDFIRAIIVNSRKGKPQISLFNKLQESLSLEEVRSILEELPSPYCDVVTSEKIPKIELTDTNMQFASWLKARKVVSSYSVSISTGIIRINKFRK